jgi:hypothetical protein
MKLTILQDDLILTMCNLATIFPPSFFDLMPHLLIHIVHEMKYLGPVFLHQMYPFEKFIIVIKSMFVIEVVQKVAWYKAGQQRKLLSLLLIICISKQLVSLFRTMKGVCLGKGHEVTLLSISIMLHTPKHISWFYNNPFQLLPMSECMSKCYEPVIQRSLKIGLQGNTETILVVDYVFKLWIRMQVFNWLIQILMT